MGWLQPIERDCFLAAVNVNGEVFVSTFDHRVRAVIWWLQWLAYAISADKDMATS